MGFTDMTVYRTCKVGYGIFFLFLSYAASTMVNYTVNTPATVYTEIVLNLTTTGEPKRSPSNDSSYDIIAEFLEKVEEYERNKEKCIPGTQFNLGKGVIQQYGINRFKRQALVAVNRANFLTRIWKSAPQAVLDSEYLFYTQVRNFVEGDPDIFAAGNCYDHREYKDLYLYCPYAYRTENGSLNVKDLSIEYDYLGNTSEWFYEAKKHAANIENFNITVGIIVSEGNSANKNDKKLKQLLICAPILRLPDFYKRLSYSATFPTHTGVGVVLLQRFDDELFLVVHAYASKKLLKRGSNYSVIKRECLAME